MVAGGEAKMTTLQPAGGVEAAAEPAAAQAGGVRPPCRARWLKGVEDFLEEREPPGRGWRRGGRKGAGKWPVAEDGDIPPGIRPRTLPSPSLPLCRQCRIEFSPNRHFGATSPEPPPPPRGQRSSSLPAAATPAAGPDHARRRRERGAAAPGPALVAAGQGACRRWDRVEGLRRRRRREARCAAAGAG